jgi:hypothetical protein
MLWIIASMALGGSRRYQHTSSRHQTQQKKEKAR